MRAALDGEACHNVEMALLRPDGTQRDLLANSTPIRDGEDRISGAVGILHDVTELKQAEQTAAERLRELETSPPAQRSATGGEPVPFGRLSGRWRTVRFRRS